MVKSILVLLLLFTFSAQADLFDFDGEKTEVTSKIPGLIKKLKDLDMKADPAYEDSFNKTVKAIENGVEEEKLFCSGEATDTEGKTLPAAQKQLCIRELKKHYLEATMVIFDMKKKYLDLIHERQIEKLNGIQTKLKADIEKSF